MPRKNVVITELSFRAETMTFIFKGLGKERQIAEKYIHSILKRLEHEGHLQECYPSLILDKLKEDEIQGI